MLNYWTLRGNPVIQLKIGINGLSGSGEFRLPDTLRTGNYLIRSCTRWMQNLSSDLFSYKRISVVNPFKGVDNIKVPSSGQAPDSIIFYPESGSLVTGIESVVGFRCIDLSGNPVAICGNVIDSNNDTLCRVQTDCSGYGLFSIKPSGIDKIYLVTGENKKNTRKYSLPDIKDSGLVFSLETTPDDDFFRIEIECNTTLDSVGRRLSLLYSPVLATPIIQEIFIETAAEIILQKENLPEGLGTISIIDESGLPIANRWVYNERKAHINYNVQIADRIYSTREKVKFQITATDNNENPVRSELMVSVVKSFSVDKAGYTNVSGLVQSPLLATISTDFNKYGINDYLIFYSFDGSLLENDKGSGNSHREYLPELRGQLVSGTIRNSITGESIKNKDIVLSFVGETAQCRFSKTDDDGYFNFVITEYGTREMVIQPLSAELNDNYIELCNSFPVAVCRYTSFPFYPDSVKLADINKAVISMQVKNIYEPFMQYKTKKPVKRDETDFYGDSVDSILVSNFIGLGSLKEIVKEIVPGVSIYNKDDKSKFKIVSYLESLPFENDPLTLVDGVPINDVDLLLTIDPLDIKKIEILRERYLISDIILEGIIHIITRKGNLSALEFEKPLFRREFEALQFGHSFNCPDYSFDSVRYSRVPDFRNTLYWNPDLTTEDSGITTVEFYTSDEPGEYTIIVEGMASDGRSGRSEISFIVEDSKSPLRVIK